MHELAAGRMLILLDVFGVGAPNLALELDQDGAVIAKQVLSLRRPDDEDPCGDLGDERELPPPIDLRHARPAPRCECADPRVDDGTCAICGHDLPVPVVEAA
jgi:hypothetical protein